MSAEGENKDLSRCSRRAFVKKAAMFAGVGLMAGLHAPANTWALTGKGEHRLALFNLHTGEDFEGVYKVGDRYLPEAFRRINYVLRDFRTGDVFPMDPQVIDVVAALHRKTGIAGPYEIISGYRSPQTNEMLRRASTGVAKRSYHMSGQAIDLRLPGIDTADLREIAISLKGGGVGYYPKSDFIHLDSGRVRAW